MGRKSSSPRPQPVRPQPALTLLFVLFVFLSTFMFRFGYIHIVMIWNLLLAAAPLGFALLARRYAQNRPDGAESDVIPSGRSAGFWIGSVLWLLFFPNAPYMITDFIHIANQSAYYMIQDSGNAAYLYDMKPWLILIHVGGSVFCGILCGLFSMRMIQRLWAERFSALVSWTAIAAASLLGGFAIYIGRFLRLNSWDILRPFRLIRKIFDDFGLFTLQYAALMGLFILFLYVAFYYLCRLIRQKGEDL